jgi:23S rRNA (uracil1939-C5)-methyltransferase
MTVPESLELEIDGIAQGGNGVGRWEGQVVFVSGALPGERVRAQVYERRPSFARARVEELLRGSPDRVPPPAPEADNMPWQHVAYPAQLRFRRTILADQLAKIGRLADAPVHETLPASPPWGYRNSARLHCDGRRLGYHAAETRTIREIHGDPLLHPALDAALPPLHQALEDLGGSAGPMEVVLRVSEAHGYVVAALLGPGARWETGANLIGQRWRGLYPPLADVAVDDVSLAGEGPVRLVEELAGVSFTLRPTTFFQVNRGVAETMLRLVHAGLELRGGERLLDVFCGAGTFALPLAREVAEVVGVEEYEVAVEDAQASAELNGVANARFVAGRAEEALLDLDGPFDAAVLDPPRRGCHPAALQALLDLAPSRVAYVSCHPATLARDLKVLTEGGYRLLGSTPVDLFPQTAHVESVSVLEWAG